MHRAARGFLLGGTDLVTGFQKTCKADPAAVKITFARGEKDHSMAKKQSAESVYRIVDVVGVSEKSWEEAGRRAIETAATSLRDVRVAEVTQMDMKVENGKVTPKITEGDPWILDCPTPCRSDQK
jgi:dodecin